MSDCNECGIINSGIECFADVYNVTYIGVMDIINSDGNANYIDIGSNDATNATNIETALYQTDPTKKLTIVGAFFNSSLVPREINTETSNRGQINKIDDLSYFTFTDGKINDVPTSYAGDLESLFTGCGNKGVIYIDDAERTFGGKKKDTDNFLYPRRIQKQSFSANPDNKDNTTGKGVILNFQEALSETKGEFAAWTYGDLTEDKLFESIKTVTIQDEGSTVNDLIISGELLYGAVNNPFVYDKTTTSNVYIDGAVGAFSASSYDDTTGNLTFTFTTPLTAPVTFTAQIIGNGYISNEISISLT